MIAIGQGVIVDSMKKQNPRKITKKYLFLKKHIFKIARAKHLHC